MERIRIHNLKPGQRFEQSLFSVTGQKLLLAGVELSDRHLQAMRRCGEVEVLLAATVEELVEAGLVDRFDGSKLTVGQRSSQGLITDAGHVLLEPGQEVEAHHLDALAAGGGAYVPKNEQNAQRRERILMADTLVEELEQQAPHLQMRVEAAASADWLQPAPANTWPTPPMLVNIRTATVEKLGKIYARLEAGLAVPAADFDPIINALMERLTKHPTRFTQLALLCPRREDYLPDHCYTVTVLAMAIGAQLNWPVEDVRRVGLAGLVYDLGMLLVPERIRTGACELSDIDRSRVRRHPVFSLAMLRVVTDLPSIIRMAALQHHERENGSGYPKGSRKDAVCDYARVLAVADTFAAITEPRHYRHPKLPYIAMEETLRSTTAMAFWKPAVKGLLQAAGLFPVGSYVKLSTGANAHVLASNPKQLDRPLVQPLDAEGKPKGQPVDLATVPQGEMSVVRPIAGATG